MTLCKERRRIFIVYNPAAGCRSISWRRGRLFADTVAALERLGCTVQVRETQGKDDGIRLARGIERTRWDVLVAAGGDGTVNEVLNAMNAQSPPLAVIPLGTANVFALELGLPCGGRKRHERLAHLIVSGVAEPRYLGNVRGGNVRGGNAGGGNAGGRRFIQMAGVGFDALVVRSVSVRAKRRWGKWAYVWRTLVGAFLYTRERYRVEIDGALYWACAVIVANGRYYGGRFVSAPRADSKVPGFYVCLFETPGALAALRYGAALVSGRLSRMKTLRIVAGRTVCIAQSLSAVTCDFPVHCDGEISARLPVRIGVAPRTVEVIGGT